MKMTKKIWIIEHNVLKNTNENEYHKPIIKYSAKEAEDYVINKYEDILLLLNNYYEDNPIKCINARWLINNGIGVARVSTIYGDVYTWRITEHEIEFDVLIDLI